MKSKKLISLLCAAAMTTSAFAGLVTTASAEGELLTLTDFTKADVGEANGTDAGKWNYSNSKQIVTAKEDDMGTYLESTITAGEGSTYNTTYTLPTPITAKNYVIEYDTSIHKSNGMNRYGKMNQVAFTSSKAAMDPREYGISGNSSTSGTGAVYSSGIASSLTSNYNIEGLWVNSYATSAGDALLTQDDAIAVENDEWVRVQAVIDTEADTATVTVINAAGEKIVENEEYTADADTLDSIHLIPGRGDASVTGQGVVCIDNVHIYEGSAKTLTTEGLRGEAAIAKPIPDPETVSGSSPTLIAPDTAENQFEASFNSSTYGDKFMSLGTEEQEPIEVVDGVNVSIGSRSQGGDGSTYASVVNTASGDKALKVAGAGFATQLRGPIIGLEDDLDVIAGSGTTSVMAFSVYLSKIDALKDAPRFWLLDNTTNVDGGKVARDVLAVFTSGDIKNEEDSPIYASGSRNIGVQITEGEWHTVVVAVSEDSYRVFVDGQYKDASGNLTPAIVSKEGVGTGEGNMSKVTHLPLIAIENAKDGSSAYSQMLVDNILTYTFTGDVKAERLPAVGEAPTPAPPTATPQPKHNVTVTYDGTDKATVSTTETEAFDAVMAIAKYSSEGVLLSVDTKDVKGISSAAGVEVAVGAMNNGDQLMVWNSLEDMIPYGSLVITNGGEQPVAITGTVEVSGRAKVGETLTAAVEGLNEGATAKYEWQANTGAEGAYEKITGATAATFEVTEDLVGKTIKVVVTAAGFDGAIESAATAAVVAADEEPVAVPTVETATLHDTTVGGVPDNELYTEGSYKVTTTPEDGYTNVAIVAENLKKHKNGDSPAIVGYWVGAAITAPEGKTIEGYYFSKDKYVANKPDFTNTSADDKETIEFYTNVGAVDQKIWAAVKLSDESIYVYKLDTTGVNLVKSAVTVAEATNGTVQVDKQTAAEGEEVTITATPNFGYEVGTVAVAPTDSDSETVVEVKDNKFTMPAEAVTVTVTFVQKANTVLSKASTYISRYSGLDEDLNTQVNKNYSDDTKVFIGSNGNYNAMGFYEFDAPEISGDKEIASATLTFVNQKMNNLKGDSSVDVNYPNVTTGIDLSTITWSTMFANTTVDDPEANPWENVQAAAPFQSVTKLSTVSLAKAETNVTHTADVTAYVKAQAAKGEKIVLVLNNCTRGANLDKVAMIEYTLGEKHYAVNVTDPEAENGTLSVDKPEALANETVTITATAAAGKKITGVTVSKAEGTVDVTDNRDGTYTFTMPAEDVTVAATYDRADINNIVVTGPKTISVNAPGTPTYVGTAYADAEKKIPLTATITYSIEAVDGLEIAEGTSIDQSTGVLTVAGGQNTGKIKVIAASEGKTGEMEVEFTSETVYTVTSATELTGGSISTNVKEAIANAEVVVTATPDTGYAITKVTYTPDEGEETEIKPQDGVYKFNMPEKNVTVSATFSKINYTITNNAAENKKDTNNGYVTVNGTANYGDTVTVTVTPNSGYDLDTLKYSGTTTPETSINNVEGAYTFVMPAENVTITATFKEIVRLAYSSVSAATPDEIASTGELYANAMRISGGKIVTNGGNEITLVRINLTGEEGNELKNAVLKFHSVCTTSGKNSNIKIARVSGIDDVTTTTWKAVAAQPATELADIGNADSNGADISYDLADDLKANGLAATYAIYTYTARQQQISNITVESTYGTPVDFNVTNDGVTEDLKVTVKGAGADNTSFTETVTLKEGAGTAVLPAGSYTYELAAQSIYQAVAATGFTVEETGRTSVNITLEEQSDLPYNVTINTVPFATVKLNAGQSTAGTDVPEQTVTADFSGVAVLSNVPAGSYTADVTTANSYYEGKTGTEITVVNDETSVDLKLDYKEEYPNMIFGENFEGYAEDTYISGGESAGDKLANLGEMADIWTLVSSKNAYERLAIRGENNTKDPALLHNNLLDGQYAYFGAFDSDAVYTGTVSKDIDKIVLDTNLDGFMGNRNNKMGMTDMDFKIGDTVLFTLTAKPSEAEASIDTIGIKSGDQVLTAKGAWVNVEITGLTSGTATVKVTKYVDGVLSEEPSDTFTAKISDVITGKVFTISAPGTNIVNAGQAGGGMALDNVEIYSAAE